MAATAVGRTTLDKMQIKQINGNCSQCRSAVAAGTRPRKPGSAARSDGAEGKKWSITYESPRPTRQRFTRLQNTWLDIALMVG